MGDCLSSEEVPPERRPIVNSDGRNHTASPRRVSSPKQNRQSPKNIQERERQLYNERLEKERIEQEQEALRQKKLEEERLENERIEKERLERERLEQERLERERLERERLEQERLEQERLEKERLERERLEQERLEQLRINKKIQDELIKHGVEKRHLQHTAKEIPHEQLNTTEKQTYRRIFHHSKAELQKALVPEQEIAIFSLLALHKPKGSLMYTMGRLIISQNFVTYTAADLEQEDAESASGFEKFTSNSKPPKNKLSIPFWNIKSVERIRGTITVARRIIVIRTRNGMKYRFVMAKYFKLAEVILRYLTDYPILYVRVEELTEEEKQRLDDMNRNLAQIVTDLKSMEGGELEIPNIAELESCLNLIEKTVEVVKDLRVQVHAQGEIIDRIDNNLHYVTQNLKEISKLVRCIDSRAATFFESLKRKKEKEHIEKVEREIGHAIGQEMVIPCILKQGEGIFEYGPFTEMEKCYLYMVEEYFAIVYRVAEVEDFHPKSRFYCDKRYVLVKNYHFTYEDISGITLLITPQLISLRFKNMETPIKIFSSFIQHIVNELDIRTKVGAFPVYCMPGAKKFQYSDVEIKKVEIPKPGRSGQLPYEVVVRPYIPPPEAPDFSMAEVKRDIAKHVQEEGIDHIIKMTTLLNQDQKLLKEELIRQTAQLQGIEERTNANLQGFHKQEHAIKRLL